MIPTLRPSCIAAALLLGSTLVPFAMAETPLWPSVPPATHPGTGQVFYFVLTDRFANGTTSNDTGGIPGGPDQHGFDPARVSHFQGGDFRGLTEKLDYIQKLGVTAVWVTPPFKNKPMQSGTAGYHGYWVTDFLTIDPHLGTNEDFREFVKQAHGRGMKVFLDIITNHTADVISYQGGETRYVSKAAHPYRDAEGKAFDEHAHAYNGVQASASFPSLDAQKSFPYVPVVAPDEANIKNPAWLNDPRYYHNRGNSRFSGENSLHGDFVGLDDVFTEHPQVVKGFIEIYTQWMRDFDVDGFRIDTARHVNTEFWQAFAPALRTQARKLKRPDFLFFGEVFSEEGDARLLSEYSTIAPLDTTLDFGFFAAARKFVSRGGTAGELDTFFRNDDWYTDHDGNIHATTTFLGNHDAGRIGHFLRQDNPGASDAELLRLMRLAHGLLFLVRGQPVVYYGDEQGMAGTGPDMAAREVMFPARAPLYQELPLIGTTRTGADDKFDPGHPLFHAISELARLRSTQRAMSHGAMTPRPTGNDNVFAFSRHERGEKVEYLAAFNNSRYERLRSQIKVSTRSAAFQKLFDSASSAPLAAETQLRSSETGDLSFTLGPLEFAVWKCTSAAAHDGGSLQVEWSAPAQGSRLHFGTRTVDGQTFPTRAELVVDVSGGDGLAEVTFLLERKSRPGQAELLGTDDAPPYRVFWRPSADLGAEEELTFVAIADNLRGQRQVARVGQLKVAATPAVEFGIKGSSVPHITRAPETKIEAREGASLNLTLTAEGTGELTYQWYKDGTPVAWANGPELVIPSCSRVDAGRYFAHVRNVAGTVITQETTVTVK